MFENTYILRLFLNTGVQCIKPKSLTFAEISAACMIALLLTSSCNGVT